MSKKLPSTPPFFKLLKSDLVYGVEAALLLAYVAEYEIHNKKCFASREHIGKQLNLSQSTVQRIIKKLTDLGVLAVSYHGNLRFIHRLSTTSQENDTKGSKLTKQGIQIEPPRGSKLTPQGIQIDTIQRYTIQRYLDKDTQYKEDSNESKTDYVLIWDETKQAMVRRRLPS